MIEGLLSGARCRAIGVPILVLTGMLALSGPGPSFAEETRKPYDYRAADLGQTRASSGAMIMPASFLREFDPVTILYARDLNPAAPGPLDRPDSLVTLKPSHPGEWRWLDPRTIEFRPAVPWKPMQTYQVRAGGESKSLTALLSPPVSISPAGGSQGLEPFSRIELEFSQPVAVDALARLVTFEAVDLPGIEGKNPRIYGAADYRIKPLEKSSGGSARYAFVFPRPFANGQRVRTIVRLAADPALTDARRVYHADTRKDFVLEKAGTWQYQFTLNSAGSEYGRDQAIRLPSDGSLILDFSAPPAGLSLSQIKSLVNFSPAPRRMEWSVSQSRVTLKLGVDQERLYRVTLAPTGIRDGDGRELRLAKPCRFWIYQPLEGQYARWGLGQGLLERYGPQHFPLLVNGMKSLDLRIHKISARHKAFWPYPDEPVRVDESEAPPGPGEEPEKEEDILRPLGAWEMQRHIRMLGAPQYSSVIDLEKEGVSRFKSIDFKPLFAKVSGPDKPGAYLVGFRPLDGSTERAYARILVTDLALATVESKSQVRFAVTSVSTAKPVPDAEVTIEGPVAGRLKLLARGRTDAQGMFALEHSALLSGGFHDAAPSRVTVRKDDDLLVLDTRPGEAPPSFADNHWAGSAPEWLSWLRQEPYDNAADRVSAGFVFTERPIYRPGEPVYFKGIIRDMYHGKVQGPDTGVSYMVVVESPARQKYEFRPRLSAANTFDDSLTEKDLPTGDYSLRLMRLHPREGESQLAATGFAVEAYRLPKFEIRLRAPDRARNDGPVPVKLDAAYYAGGKVAGRPVAWRVVSFPYAYVPEGVKGFILSTDARYGAVEGEQEEGALEQQDATDDNGQAVLAVNPQAAAGGNPRKFLVEATVTDADDQTFANRVSFLALPPFVLGLKAERNISEGSSVKGQVAAFGLDGKFEAGVKVSVQLRKMSWVSYLQETDFSRGKPKYRTRESIDLVAEKTVTTGKAPVTVEFPGQDPGVFVLELSSRDRLGRLQTVKADLFLAGSKPVAWKKPERQLFETVPDKDRYLPGDEARILLKSPFGKARALAVIERPDGDPEYRWIDIENGQGTLALAIAPEMSPRIPIGFLLMRPRIGDEKLLPDGTVVDAARPQTLGNTTWLKVEPAANRLKVDLAHPSVVRPGSQMDMTLTLKDDKGNPRPGEVALWLVDEAVLALRKERPLDPLPAFTPRVETRITLRDTRNLIMGDLRLAENPGGDGQVGAEGFFGKMTVRRNFKPVPYWNPAVPVDKTGRATVKISMSDDLTNFAVRAVAVSGEDRFGTASSQVRVRLPVLVQPALPRFVRLGDRFRAGGTARVTEGPGGAATWSIDARGLKLAKAGGPAVETAVLDAQKAVPLKADLIVVEPGFDAAGRLKSDSVTVRMAVERKSDKASDAFAVSIPLKLDRPLESQIVSAELAPGKPLAAAALPGSVRPGTLARDLLVSDQLGLLKALGAMTYLVRYPYGCAEQRLSMVMPAVAYRDIWARFGLDAPLPDVKRSVGATLEYLAQAQTPDGLIGYWPGSTGYIHLTAYAVEFLTELKRNNEKARAGYPFDESLYAKALAALERGLRSDYTRFIDGFSYYERSCALQALAVAGKLDVGYARELAAAAGESDVQSQARVYRAMLANPGPLKSEVAALRERLWKQTVFKRQDGKEVFAGLQQRSFRIGAPVHAGEVTALAGMVRAFSADPSRPEKLPLLVDEFVALGGGDSWGSTADNGLGLLALRDFLAGPTGRGKVAGTLICGGDPAAHRRMEYDRAKGSWTARCADPGKIELRVEAAAGKPLFARLTQRWLPAEPGSKAPAVQKGFVVKRELVFVESGKEPRHVPIEAAGSVQAVKVGDIVEEHVQVQNPKTRHWVAVNAPFAAGMEYLNPRLETTGEEAKPEGSTTHAGDYQTFLDDGATWFFATMPEGTYDFYFRVRASIEGEFSLPPARAEMMYEMGTYGSSPGAQVSVRPAQ